MIGDFPHGPDWPALHEYEGVLLHRDVPVVELAPRAAGRLVYLATPYTRRAVDENGRWSLEHSIIATAEATRWAWALTRAGLSVISPVMMATQMLHDEYAANRPHDDALGPLNRDGWETWCRPMLGAAQALAVPPIDGWAESLGVWRETCAALGAMKPVFVLGEG